MLGVTHVTVEAYTPIITAIWYLMASSCAGPAINYSAIIPGRCTMPIVERSPIFKEVMQAQLHVGTRASCCSPNERLET
jgi:hypothetical protein